MHRKKRRPLWTKANMASKKLLLNCLGRLTHASLELAMIKKLTFTNSTETCYIALKQASVSIKSERVWQSVYSSAVYSCVGRSKENEHKRLEEIEHVTGQGRGLVRGFFSSLPFLAFFLLLLLLFLF